MDRRERYHNPEETLRIAMQSMMTRVWTALPAIVQSFNPARMTVSVQPTINGRILQEDGTFKSWPIPILVDCPVVWQGGGGALLTFPIKNGDECLVVFSSRCIDSWWSQGGIQDPPEARMHNLSDGFAIVGVRSLPRALNVDMSNVQLRSDDGSTVVNLNPTAQTIGLTAPGGITLNGVTIDSSGNVVTSGNVTSKGKVLATHVHGGVNPGGSNTGAPV